MRLRKQEPTPGEWRAKTARLADFTPKIAAIESGNELDGLSAFFILLPREDERSFSSIGTPNALGFAV